MDIGHIQPQHLGGQVTGKSYLSILSILLAYLLTCLLAYATGPEDALPLCRSHNSGRRENMLKCIERECNLARPKVDWRMHRYYVELKKGIREELYP